MRKIALIPVYNEKTTLVSVFDGLRGQVDRLVIVDDGSSDGSLELAREWATGKRGVKVLCLPANRGMSAALREGFAYLAACLRTGELDGDDLVFTLDADGQHDAREIGALAEHVESRALDVALTRRDFSLYPAHKKLGNRFMTLWGSLWSGHRYNDIESGFRAMRLRVLPPLLEYYAGHRYSCAQEIGILTARLGFSVDNSFTTVIRLYRSQTAMRDVVLNAALGFGAFLRWALRRKAGPRPAAAATSSAPERS